MILNNSSYETLHVIGCPSNNADVCTSAMIYSTEHPLAMAGQLRLTNETP